MHGDLIIEVKPSDHHVGEAALASRGIDGVHGPSAPRDRREERCRAVLTATSGLVVRAVRGREIGQEHRRSRFCQKEAHACMHASWDNPLPDRTGLNGARDGWSLRRTQLRCKGPNQTSSSENQPLRSSRTESFH